MDIPQPQLESEETRASKLTAMETTTTTTTIDRVVFCVFGGDDRKLYERLIPLVFGQQSEADDHQFSSAGRSFSILSTGENKKNEASTRVTILQGDITRLKGVDAIVNAAKSTLLGGGGVDGAIHAAAGPGLLAECRTLGGCEVGKAKMTGAYKLPYAKAIIHTVGPRLDRDQRKPDDEQRTQLAACYMNSLDLAVREGRGQIRSVAFPCISTGIYGYPKEEAARLALQTVHNWLQANQNGNNNVKEGQQKSKEITTGKHLLTSEISRPSHPELTVLITLMLIILYA